MDKKLLYIRMKEKLFSLIIHDDTLMNVCVYDEKNASLLDNIYIGRVTKISSNIHAAFVDIAPGKSCFLSLSDVKNPILLNRPYNGELKAGDEIALQVIRDAIKTKQPAVSTRLSLAGTYLVVSVGSDKLGISQKILDSDRKKIADFLKNNELIDEHTVCQTNSPIPIGVVIRTNASKLDDYAPLLEEWKQLTSQMEEMLQKIPHRTCFSVLKESNVPYLQDLQDIYTTDYDEIVTDCEDVYNALQTFAAAHSLEVPIRLYKDSYPLSKLYSIATKLKGALESRVWLKSGGYLVIEPTEALTSIDVNTGKFEPSEHKFNNMGEMYYAINMEAAEEIAHQLKLRNLSGIIIVDFINMNEEAQKAQLIKYLKQITSKDSVRTTVIDITPLGLVEITRKKVARPLRELIGPEFLKNGDHVNATFKA